MIAEEVGGSDEELFQFFKTHPNFFNVRGDLSVSLSHNAWTVASAWEFSALPTYPKNQIR